MEVTCGILLVVLQAAVMVPMVIALILGFSTSLMVVYKHAAMPEYSTVTGAMRMLVGVTGGSIDMLVSLYTQQLIVFTSLYNSEVSSLL